MICVTYKLRGIVYSHTHDQIHGYIHMEPFHKAQHHMLARPYQIIGERIITTIQRNINAQDANHEK